MRLRLVSALAFTALVPLAAASAQDASLGVVSCGVSSHRPPVQPTTHTSPDGVYALRVDPTRRDGSGGADCELRRGDESVWRARLPYRLRFAAVADDGRAVGYALTESRSEHGDHLFVAFDVRGSARTTAQFPSRAEPPHGRHDDLIELAWNPTSDVLFTRFATADASRQVQLYSAADGKLLLSRGDWPTQVTNWADRSLGTSGLPGTRLFVHRRFSTNLGGRSTLSTYLLDDALNVVWWSDARGVQAAGDARFQTVPFDPPRLAARVTGDASFDAPMPSPNPARPELGTLFSCIARPDATALRGWRVDTSAPKPWAGMGPLDVDAARPLAAPIALETLGEVVLGDAAARAAAPIHHVVSWQVPSSGQPEFIRAKGNARAFTSVRLAADGSAEFERDVPNLPLATGAVRWFPLDAGRWLVACEQPPTDGAQSWRYDADANMLTALEYAGPAIVAAVRGPEGGMYVLAEDPESRWLPQFIRRCDARGRELWTQRKETNDFAKASPTQLARPNALAPAQGGGVYACDAKCYAHEGMCACFWHIDPDGSAKPVREHVTTDAVIVHGILPFAADERGDLSVAVDSGVPCFAQGFALVALQRERPRLPNGTAFSAPIRLAAGGALWGYQRGSFRRFALDRTRVATTFESARMPPRVAEPASAWIERERVFVHDAQTDCLHEFDAAGRVAKALGFDPVLNERFELVGPRGDIPFAMGPDGRVVFRGRSGGVYARRRDGQRIESSAGGQLVGWSSSGAPRWRRRGEAIELLGDDGAARALVERGADRRFFESVGAAATSSGGAALVVEEQGRSRTAEAVHVVGADGTPLRSAPVPRDLIELRSASAALESDWAALFGGDTHVWLYRVSEDAWYSFEPPSADEHSGWSFGISSDGKELWGVELYAMRLHRYRLPE
jgi:hypothetical protein